MTDVRCPECGGNKWIAIEGATVTKPVGFEWSDTGLVIDIDPFSEFEIESQTTVLLAYKCAWQLCPFSVPADKMPEFVKNQLKEN